MNRLTQLRIDKRLSPRQLAQLADVSYQQVLNIERGETTNPTVATLHKLAGVLEAKPSELLMDALPPRHDMEAA